MTNDQCTMQYADWLNLNTHLLWCYDGLTTKNPSVTTSYVNNSAWLVRQGWARVEHGKQVHIAYPGQWLIVKPGDRIQQFDSNTHLLSIAFNAQWPDGSKWFDDGLSVILDNANCPELEKTGLSMVGFVNKIGSGHWDLRNDSISALDYLELERHLMEWLSTLVSVLERQGITPAGKSGMDERVAKAVRLLNGADLGEGLDLDYLSRHVGVSLVHLTRLFQRDLHITPKLYYTKLRVEYARENLSVQGARVSDVSALLGFSNISNFSNWFKKHTGESPRTYSRKSRVVQSRN